MLSLSYMNLFRSREARCENLVLTCIDFRFRRSVGDVLALAGYAEFDHLALPGGSNAVIDEASRPTVLRADHRG